MIKPLHAIPPMSPERLILARKMIRKLEKLRRPSPALDRRLTEFFNCPGGGARRVKFTSSRDDAEAWADSICLHKAFRFEITVATGRIIEPHPSGGIPRLYRAICTVSLRDRQCTAQSEGEGCTARAITAAALELYCTPTNPPAEIPLPQAGAPHGLSDMAASPDAS